MSIYPRGAIFLRIADWECLIHKGRERRSLSHYDSRAPLQVIGIKKMFLFTLQYM